MGYISLKNGEVAAIYWANVIKWLDPPLANSVIGDYSR